MEAAAKLARSAARATRREAKTAELAAIRAAELERLSVLACLECGTRFRIDPDAPSATCSVACASAWADRAEARRRVIEGRPLR